MAGLLFLGAGKAMDYVGQDKEAFVNESRLFVVLIVSQSLTARQIHQIQDGFGLGLQSLDLEDSMGSRGVVMVFFRAVRPLLFAQLQQLLSLLV